MRRLGLLAPLALLLAVVPPADGEVEVTVVRVTMSRTACAVAPRSLAVGVVTFRIVNRSARPGTFSIARKRAIVGAGRAARLTVSLRAGRVTYACTVARRRAGGGILRVKARPRPAAEHRIGVRTVNGFGEFYDRTNGAKFVPRGNNYIRLAPQLDTFGRTQVYHSTFIVGEYDPARADAALARMAAAGYNVVRVFLNNTCAQGCSANMRTGTISSPYVANLVDYLRRARAHGVFVMLTAEWLPSGAVYDALSAGLRWDWFEHVNSVFLTPQGIEMSARFWRDLVRELIRQQAPLDAIFAYSLWNEAQVAFDHRPFTLSSGRVTTANGQTYDMASNAERRRMIDDAFVHYTDQVRAAILEVDPTGLVTIGFWTSPDVAAGAVIERSKADFVDVHPYPAGGLTFGRLIQDYGIAGPATKPVVMGEFGAFTSAYPSPAAALSALVAWQRDSCPYGIDGWFLWTWDTDEQPELWNALRGGGAIGEGLAPKSRPDPCT